MNYIVIEESNFESGKIMYVITEFPYLDAAARYWSENPEKRKITKEITVEWRERKEHEKAPAQTIF